MTREEFIDTIKRINPYITITDHKYVDVPEKDSYSITLDDESFSIRCYYSERDYMNIECRYDEIDSAEDIPEEFKMSPFLKIRETIIMRMKHINHPIISKRIDRLMIISNLNELLEEVLYRYADFYLGSEIVNETVVKNHPECFGNDNTHNVIYNSEINTYIVYAGEPRLLLQDYANIIVLGDSKPDIKGGCITRCYGKSKTKIDTNGYVEVHSKEAYAIGKANVVISDFPDCIDFGPTTHILQKKNKPD